MKLQGIIIVWAAVILFTVGAVHANHDVPPWVVWAQCVSALNVTSDHVLEPQRSLYRSISQDFITHLDKLVHPFIRANVLELQELLETEWLVIVQTDTHARHSLALQAQVCYASMTEYISWGL